MKSSLQFRFPTVDTVLNCGVLCVTLTLVAYAVFGRAILEVLV